MKKIISISLFVMLLVNLLTISALADTAYPVEIFTDSVISTQLDSSQGSFRVEDGVLKLDYWQTGSWPFSIANFATAENPVTVTPEMRNNAALKMYYKTDRKVPLLFGLDNTAGTKSAFYLDVYTSNVTNEYQYVLVPLKDFLGEGEHNFVRINITIDGSQHLYGAGKNLSVCFDDIVIDEYSALYAENKPGYIKLSWDASSASDALYNVYRDGVKINAEPIDTLYYEDGEALPGVKYSYQVNVVKGGKEYAHTQVWNGMENATATDSSVEYQLFAGGMTAWNGMTHSAENAGSGAVSYQKTLYKNQNAWEFNIWNGGKVTFTDGEGALGAALADAAKTANSAFSFRGKIFSDKPWATNNYWVKFRYTDDEGNEKSAYWQLQDAIATYDARKLENGWVQFDLALEDGSLNKDDGFEWSKVQKITISSDWNTAIFVDDVRITSWKPIVTSYSIYDANDKLVQAKDGILPNTARKIVLRYNRSLQESTVSNIRILSNGADATQSVAYNDEARTVTVTFGELTAGKPVVLDVPETVISLPSVGQTNGWSWVGYAGDNGSKGQAFSLKYTYEGVDPDQAKPSIKLVDAVGEVVDEPVAVDTMVYAIVNTKVADAVTGFAAVYSGDRLVRMVSIPVGENDATGDHYSIPFGVCVGESVRLFVWNSVTGMTPANDVVDLF